MTEGGAATGITICLRANVWVAVQSAGTDESSCAFIVVTERILEEHNIMRKPAIVGFLTLTLAWLMIGVTSGLAQSRIEKLLKLEPGGRFELDSVAGSARVTGTTRPGARVVVTSERDDIASLLSFSFEELPGLVRVTARRKPVLGWLRRLALHYEVEVPHKASVEIKTGGGSVRVYSVQGDTNVRTSGGSVEVGAVVGNVLAHTSGGSITLRDVTGETRANTSGGSIQVDALDGELRAATSGGAIRVRDVTGDVDVETSGGPIHIEGAGGRVRTETTGGSIEVAFDRGNERGGEIATSGGSIRVALDPSVNLELDASTSGGSVVTDLPIKVTGRISGSSLRGTLGSGGALLRIHTSGGSIRIERR